MVVDTTQAMVLGPVAPLRGQIRLTTQRAQRGYRLSVFLTSLRDAPQRAAFAADPEACMAAAGLDEIERDLLRRRDLPAMLEYGAALVALGKALRVFDVSLLAFGAMARGQSAEQFVTERRRANEGQPWQF